MMMDIAANEYLEYGKFGALVSSIVNYSVESEKFLI